MIGLINILETILMFLSIASLITIFLILVGRVFKILSTIISFNLPFAIVTKNKFMILISSILILISYIFVVKLIHNRAIQEIQLISDSELSKVIINSKSCDCDSLIQVGLNSIIYNKEKYNESNAELISINLFYNGLNTSLDLCFDQSENKRIWIFYPKYRLTSINPIGYVTNENFIKTISNFRSGSE